MNYTYRLSTRNKSAGWLWALLLAASVLALYSSSAAWLDWGVDLLLIKSVLIFAVIALGYGQYRLRRQAIDRLRYDPENQRLQIRCNGQSDFQDVELLDSCLNSVFIYLQVQQLDGQQYQLLLNPGALGSRQNFHQLLAIVDQLRKQQSDDFF